MSNENKKVGILTFSYSSNPGSVLQAYALQQTISRIGNCRASIVNYQKTQADKPIFGSNIFFGSIRTWTPKKVIAWTVRWLAYPLRMKKYHLFFKKYYNSDPKKPCGREDMTALAEQYDAFVVGSDQVWNFDSINVDYTYFLDFVKTHTQKISYAASFGQKGVPEAEKEKAAALIGEFSAISVREKEGVVTVGELTSKSAEWVLDPSLIFPEEQWHSMAIAPKETDYVFLYLRERSAPIEQFAKELAARNGLRLVSVYTHWKLNKHGKKQKALGPCEWLGYMKNARYVVTNSFHGICFSIVYKKDFFVNLLKGARAFTNPRIAGLLDQFGLNNRCIDVVTDLVSPEPIDYQTVDMIKRKREEQSLHFLKNALDGVIKHEE